MKQRTNTRDATRRLASLLDGSAEAVVLLQNDRPVYANRAFERITGYRAGQMADRDFWTLLEPGQREAARQAAGRAIKGGRAGKSIEATAIARDGRRVNIELSFRRAEHDGVSTVACHIRDVTALKELQQRLKESELRYGSILEGISDVVVALGVPDGRFLTFNRQALKLSGYSARQFAEMTFSDLVHPDDLPKVMSRFRARVMGKEVEETYEIRILDKRGREIALEISVKPYLIQGRAVGTVVIGRDVTARRLAEQKILRSNRQLQALNQIAQTLTEFRSLERLLVDVLEITIDVLSAAGGAVYLMDADAGRLVLKTHRGLDAGLLGKMAVLPVDEPVIGRVLRSSRPLRVKALLEGRPQWIKIADKFGAGEAMVFALRAKKKTLGFMGLIPQSRFTESEVQILKAIGNQIGVAVENARLYDEIRSSEEKYQILADQANDGIFVAQDGVYRYVNAALARMTGYRVRELTGRDLSSILDPAYEDFLYERYRESVSGRRARDVFEVRLRSRDGAALDAEASVRTITYEGRPAALTLVRDITERKRLMGQLIEERNLARFFNDIMSHDISNFNQAALGCLGALEEVDPPLNEECLSYVKTCARQIQRTTALIARIREFVDIRSMSTTQFIRLDLSRIIPRVIEQVREVHPDALLTIRYRPAPGRMVRANSLIEVLLLNLIDNAVSHNPSDRKIVWIGVRAHRLEGRDYWRIGVSDNGKGITDANKQRLFERFARRSPGRKAGLGLFIVRELAEKFGGRVHVEDRVPGDPSQGGCFVLLLPRA